jgi:toxin ParE1/3/4
MAEDVAEIEAKIRALSAEERAELIRSLIADLDGPEEAGVEQAWLEEAERRHRELLDGKVKGGPRRACVRKPALASEALMNLEFHPEAELELLEAAFRYDLEVPGLGERFGTEVQRVTDLLLEYPNIGKEVGSGRRKFSLHRFPFTLIYATSPEFFTS